MKLALVIAFAPDQRSGRVLGGVVTADMAIKTVKDAINAGKSPDARFPNLAAVVLSDVIRKHRFQVTQAEIDQAGKDLENIAAEGLAVTMIPVEIGEGEEMVIINVTTQEEADFLKGLATAAFDNCEEIKRLQKSMGDELSAHQTSMEAAQKELAACFESFDKLRAEKIAADAVITQLKTDLEQRETVLQARQAEIESCQGEVGKRDERIKELETQLTEAAAKARKK